MSAMVQENAVHHFICGVGRVNGMIHISEDNDVCFFKEEDICLRVADYATQLSKHRNIICKIAKKMGYTFDAANHDNSKLEDPEILRPLAVCDYFRRNKKQIPQKWQIALSHALTKHYEQEPHHPEHFILMYDDANAVNKMNYNQLREMCCDWVAMAKEFTPEGRTPDARNFAKANLTEFGGSRWKFDKPRTRFIMNTLTNIYIKMNQKER